MNYTIRIKRQENPQASPCWQEFTFEGSADTSIASVLNELNHRSPLCEKSGTVVSPIAWECGCMIRKCGACAMRINGLPRLACSVFLRDCKGSVVTLEPLSKFPLVKDLVVDRSVIFEALKRTKLWLEGDAFQTSYTHSQRYQSAKCLLCGCCLEVCPNFDPNSEFAGAVLPVNAYRILNEGQDIAHRTELANAYRQLYFEGCGKSLACQDICPAGIPVEELMSCSNAAAVWKR